MPVDLFEANGMEAPLLRKGEYVTPPLTKNQPVDLFQEFGFAPPKEKVGAGEAFVRGAGNINAGMGDIFAKIPGGAASLADTVASAITGNETNALRDAVFSMTQPAIDVTENAKDYYSLDPATEEFTGTPAEFSYVGGQLAGALPAMMATGGSAGPAGSIPGVMARGATAMSPLSFPMGAERRETLIEGGVDEATANKTAAIDTIMLNSMGVIPVSLPGGLATRAITGAGVNVPLGMGFRGVEEQVLGPEYAEHAAPIMGGKQTAFDASLGAVMAAIFGPRGMGFQRLNTIPWQGKLPGPQAEAPLSPLALPPPKEAPLGLPVPSQRATGEPLPPSVRTDVISEQPVTVTGKELAVTPEQRAEVFAPDLAKNIPEGTIPQRSEAMGMREQGTPVARDLIEQAATSEGRTVKEIVERVTGVSRPPTDIKAADVDAALAEPTGRRLSEQPTQQERPETAGDQLTRDLRDLGISEPVKVEEPAAPKEQEMTELSDVDMPPESEASKILDTIPEKPIETALPPSKKPLGTEVSGTRQEGETFALNPKGKDKFGDEEYTSPETGRTADIKPWVSNKGHQVIITDPRADLAGDGVHVESIAGPRSKAEEYLLGVTEKEPESTFSDNRLKRESFRANLTNMASELTEGGGIVLTGGRFSEGTENVATDQLAPVTRTKSQNPQWFQEMNTDPSHKVSVKKLNALVAKAVAGEKLGAREQRVVEYMLNHVTGERTEPKILAEAQERRTDKAQDRVESARERTAIQEEKPLEQNNLKNVDDDAVLEARKNYEAAEERYQTAKRAHAADPEQVTMKDVEREMFFAEHEHALWEKASGERPKLELVQEPEAGIREREASQAEAKRAESESQRAEDEKIQADIDRETFKLTGSERKSDADSDQVDIIESQRRGTEFFSNPVFDPRLAKDFINSMAKIFGVSNEHIADMKVEMEEFYATVRNELNADERYKGNILADMGRVLFFSDSSVLQSLGKRHNSKAIAKLHDKFEPRRGAGESRERGYSSELTTRATANENGFLKALTDNDLYHDAAAHKQIIALLEHRDNIRPGTPVHDAAKGLGKLLDDELAHQRESGLEVGETKNYYPVVFDNAQILNDKPGFLAGAKKAYMEVGLTDSEATQAADNWFAAEIYKDMGMVEHPFADVGNIAPNANFTKSRKFTPAALKHLDKFRSKHLIETLQHYFRKSARRSAWESRLGGVRKEMRNGKEVIVERNVKYNEFKKELMAEGNGHLEQRVLNVLRTMTGEAKNDMGLQSRKAVSWLKTLGVIEYLKWATYTSLVEPAIAATQTRNLADIPRSYFYTAQSMTNRLKDYMKSDWSRNMTEVEARAALDMMGITTSDFAQMSTTTARLEGGYDAKIPQWIANKGMRLTALHSFTESTRTSMGRIGARYIKSISESLLSDNPPAYIREELNDLGIPENKHHEFANWIANMDDADWGGAPISQIEAGGDMMNHYITAMNTIVDGVIMRPKAEARPRFAKHPGGGLAYQLLSFQYQFHKDVLTRVARTTTRAADPKKPYTARDRAKLLTPLVALATLPIIAYGLLPFREKMREREEQTAKKTPLKRIGESISRSGIFGAPLDPLINLFTSVKYSRELATSATGPVISGQLKTIQDTLKLFGDRNSPNTRNQERQVLRDIYMHFLDPAMSMAAAIQPIKPLGAAAIQAVGSKQFREGFVDFIYPELEDGGRTKSRTKSRTASRTAAR